MEVEKVKKENTVIKAIYFLVWDTRVKLTFLQNRLVKGVITFVIGMLLVVAVCHLFNVTGIWHSNSMDMFLEYNVKSNDFDFAKGGFTYQDVLFTQISVTFLVISLTTVLSSSAKVIYWIDKIELELVEPIFTDFLAFTMYSFACLGMSIYYILQKSDFVYVSFFMSILVMAWLTLKLINVYFESQWLKQKISFYYDWIKENGSKEEKEHLKNVFVNMTVQYAIENNLSAFLENLDFILEKYSQSKVQENMNQEKNNEEQNKLAYELGILCLIINMMGKDRVFFINNFLGKFKKNGLYERYKSDLLNEDENPDMIAAFRIYENELDPAVKTLIS